MAAFQRCHSSSDETHGALYGLLSASEGEDLECRTPGGDEDERPDCQSPTVIPHSATLPCTYDRLPCGGERFGLALNRRLVVVQCELQPRPRLRVLLDGAVRRETGAITRGFRVQLLGQYDVACHYQPFLLGGGLGLAVNRRVVANSFWDPDVLLTKARLPAVLLTLCLSAQTLVLVLAGGVTTWQWVSSTVAVAVCVISAGVWDSWPETAYWLTLGVAGLELVGSSTSLATSWALAQQVPQWLAMTGVCLVALKAWLLYLMARCMP